MNRIICYPSDDAKPSSSSCLCVNIFDQNQSNANKFSSMKNFQQKSGALRGIRKPIFHLCIDFSGSTSIPSPHKFIVANLLTHRRSERVKTNIVADKELLSIFISTTADSLSLSSAQLSSNSISAAFQFTSSVLGDNN